MDNKVFLEMVELLACLTGYVESRWDDGDGAAPIENAKAARAILNQLWKERN